MCVWKHELSKVSCDYCLKQYESVVAYKQHFKKGNCKTFEMEGGDDKEGEEGEEKQEDEQEDDLSMGVVYK